MGPCLCGDLCCSSCGPAQGNSRCPICREWISEGCAHIGEDGKVLPEWEEQAKECEAAEAAAEEGMAKFEEDAHQKFYMEHE